MNVCLKLAETVRVSALYVLLLAVRIKEFPSSWFAGTTASARSELSAVCRLGAESQGLPLDTSKIITGLCYVYIPFSYRAVNTLRLGYKTSQLMLYREIIAVCSQIHTKHINTLCGQKSLKLAFSPLEPSG